MIVAELETRTYTTQQMMDVRIHSITYSAEGVLLFELRAPDGGSLEPFEPGAHIDVRMPGGLSRSYSLLNDCREQHRYVIGVQRDAKSRGGSAWMHESARVGAQLSITSPKNNFPLYEDAEHSVFIAGGIGITPLWCMIQRLESLGRNWALHYSARSQQAAALLDAIANEQWADRVHFNFDDQSRGKYMDLKQIIAFAPKNAHFYCCGPAPMLKAYEEVCANIDPARVHLEHFGATDTPAVEGGYVVHLARSGRSIEVSKGQTILEALQLAGLDVPSSCQQGVCGVCETTVLQGIPDHRDLVLTDDEKKQNNTMMICCSGSLTSDLTLDI